MDELLKQLNTLNELSAARNNYAKTLALLAALKAGTVTLDNVTLTDDGWQVAAIQPDPSPEPPPPVEAIEG
jgi:hypothetical protein